jgi:hypothetical protein
VNADAHHIARLDGGYIERLERLVHDDGRTEPCRCRGGEHEQPARRDDGGAERQFAGIDEVDSHASFSCVKRVGNSEDQVRRRTRHGVPSG